MKEKDITEKVLVITDQSSSKNNIHLLLEKTIEQRNKILPLWEEIFILNKPVKQDVHAQLKITIAELSRTKEQLKYFFENNQGNLYHITGKSAA